MKRKFIKTLLYGFYLLIVTMLLLEIAVRFWGYSEHHLSDPIYTRFDRAPEEIPYVHKPNLSQSRARGLAIINTDSLGLRSKIAGAAYDKHEADEYRIALVGDSVTFGEGITKTEDTFAQVLESNLNQRQKARKVKVFNFAASAYSVRVMAATLRYRMMDVEPDLVLMAIVPADFNLPRTPEVDAWGYLTDKKLSSYLPRDSRVRLVLRKFHTLYLLRDVVYPWLDKTQSAEQILSAGSIPDSYSFLQEFRGTANEDKLDYALVLLPSRNSDFGKVPEKLREEGFSFLDLTNVRDQFTSEQFHANKFDPHPSPLVHQKIGEDLADYVFENYLKRFQR